MGNDIVCVVFLEADNTTFSPACIKSHFLHTFIVVRTSPRIKYKPTRYEVTIVRTDLKLSTIRLNMRSLHVVKLFLKPRSFDLEGDGSP